MRQPILLNAHSLRIPLPDGSVHCVVTSPPYWGLRSYNLPPLVWGGANGCGHAWGDRIINDTRGTQIGKASTIDARESTRGQFCQLCNAWRGSLGLEPRPGLYVQHVVEIFREVRRVLRPDGTLWLNIGDSYAGSGPTSQGQTDADIRHATVGNALKKVQRRVGTVPNLKPKDLIGIPWMVAFALRADGWWLRDAIIWAKADVSTDEVPMFDMPVGNVLAGSAMPGSQRDRCTNAYEFIFQFTKSKTYYFDQEAEKTTSSATLRNVWRMNSRGYKGAHFATFCEELPRRCIKLGTSERGVCPRCGGPWERVTEKPNTDHASQTGSAYPAGTAAYTLALLRQSARDRGEEYTNTSTTIGWRPTCTCWKLAYYVLGMTTREDWCKFWYPFLKILEVLAPVPATVLDPFVGSGTTLLMARKLGRHGIGLDLSLPYLRDQARTRLSLDALAEWENGKETREEAWDELPLFAQEGRDMMKFGGRIE